MEEKTAAEIATEKFTERVREVYQTLEKPENANRTYADDQVLEISGAEFTTIIYNLAALEKGFADMLAMQQQLYTHAVNLSNQNTALQVQLMEKHIEYIGQGKSITESEQKTQEAKEDVKVVKLNTGKK